MADEISYVMKSKRNKTQLLQPTEEAAPPKPAKMSSIPISFLRKVQFMEKYPQSLKDYIKKCFAQCEDDKSQEIISNKLFNKINSISAQGVLNQKNWVAEPLVELVDKKPDPPVEKKKPNKGKNKKFKKQKQQQQQQQHENQPPKQAFNSDFINQQLQQQLHMAIMQQQYPGMQRYSSYPYQPPYSPPYQQMPPPPPPPPPHNYNIGYPMQQPLMNQNPDSRPPDNYQYPNIGAQQNTQQYQYGQQQQSYNQNINQNQYQNNFQNQQVQNQRQLGNQKHRFNNFQNNNELSNNNGNNSFNQNLHNSGGGASFAPGQNFPKAQYNPPPISSTWGKPPANPSSDNNMSKQQSLQSQKNAQKPNLKNAKNKNNKVGKFLYNTQNLSNDDIAKESHIIVGTSTKLEKEYLRLAGDSELDPSNFRPLSILKKSLNFCLNKFKNNNDYEYISEQLRSIRQDIRVQHIEDPFCVLVYETHAKLAIENGDWGNFNQSMEPLESLYRSNFGEFSHICQFYCYRILYLIGVDDIAGLYSFIPRIEQKVFESKDVQFALNIWRIASSGEWMRFFRKMKKAPPHVAGVMQIKAQSFRDQALSCIQKGFRQIKFTMEDYRTFLCFDDDDATRRFLIDAEITIPDE